MSETARTLRIERGGQMVADSVKGCHGGSAVVCPMVRASARGTTGRRAAVGVRPFWRERDCWIDPTHTLAGMLILEHNAAPVDDGWMMTVAQSPFSPFVYFARNPITGLVKIGMSRNVAARLRDIGAACGCELEVLTIMPGGRRVERAIHEALREYQAHREWFRPAAPVLELAQDGRVCRAFRLADSPRKERKRAA